jgi:hypothetical protein
LLLLLVAYKQPATTATLTAFRNTSVVVVVVFYFIPFYQIGVARTSPLLQPHIAPTIQLLYHPTSFQQSGIEVPIAAIQQSITAHSNGCNHLNRHCCNNPSLLQPLLQSTHHFRPSLQPIKSLPQPSLQRW